MRRTGRTHSYVDRMYTPDKLHEALPEADFVVVTAALTKETKLMIGASELDLLKPGAGFINSRAQVVDYEALAERLRTGRIGGAILDVFDPEPLPADSALWDCPNLIITPHVSSDPANYNQVMLAIFVSNLSRFVAGKPLRNRVSVERGY